MSGSPWTVNNNVGEEDVGEKVSLGLPAEKKEEQKIEKKRRKSRSGSWVRFQLFPSLLSSGSGKLWDAKPHNIMVNGNTSFLGGDCKLSSYSSGKEQSSRPARHPQSASECLGRSLLQATENTTQIPSPDLL